MIFILKIQIKNYLMIKLTIKTFNQKISKTIKLIPNNKNNLLLIKNKKKKPKILRLIIFKWKKILLFN